MTPVYMPFTYLSESTARLLAGIVGPVVLYQPLSKKIPERLTELAEQGVVEIRTPMRQDDDRLGAALTEFTAWAKMNPGKSTPGTGFFSAQQGTVPFFEETSINRIRADIKRYNTSGNQTDEVDIGFSARLFLSVAQENDMAIDQLNHDLMQAKSLENDFLATLQDADVSDFNRQVLAGEIWPEDPGAKLTDQRLRAWATLAAADAKLPELLVTTSPAVIDTLLETSGQAASLEKLSAIRLSVPSAGTPPVLDRVLADLAAQEVPSSADLSSFEALSAEAASDPAVTVTLFIAVNRTPATVINRISPATAAQPEENGEPKSVCHTLLALVKG